MRTLKAPGLGSQIKAAREAAGLTQPELARLAGLHQPHVSALERGAKAPTIDTLCRLASAMGVDFAYDGKAVRFG